jgi:galactonate dehydratase
MPNHFTLRRMRLAAQTGSIPRSGPHQVRDVRMYPLREPVSGRTYTVIAAETDSGLKGHGECGEVAAREWAQLRGIVVGVTATALEPIRRALASLPALQAAINMALLDITGQIAKAPIYQVLGGPTRNKVRALAPIEGKTDEELKQSLERALKAGNRAFSVPLPPVTANNHGQAFVMAVRRRMEGLRLAAGEGADFVLDGAQKLSPGDASSVAEALERFHLLWLDEPCPLSNVSAVRKITDENVTPVGFGRDIHTGGEFQDLLREGAIDVLRPDIGRNGITQIRRMATIAETYYVAVAPYHDGGPIASAAALHLAASLPNFFIQQFPTPAAEKDRQMRADLTSANIEQVRDGYVPLLTGPGLGVKVNEEALKRYAAS